jgi:hypothetical protein
MEYSEECRSNKAEPTRRGHGSPMDRCTGNSKVKEVQRR